MPTVSFAVGLAFISCLSYSVASVVGGMLTRRQDARVTLLGAQLIGTVIMLPLAIASGGVVEIYDLEWGAAAGVFSTVGTVLSLRALAVGKMAVVTSLFGVMTGFVPFVGGLALGERPGKLGLGAVVLGLASTILAAQASPGGDSREGRTAAKANRLSLLSGASIGAQRIVMSFASTGAGLWMLVTLRVVTVVSLLGVVTAVSWWRLQWFPMAAIGVLFVVGDVSFVVAAHTGNLTIAGIVVALTPAVVALIARVALGQRLTMPQLVGVVGALTSIVLFAVSAT